MAAKPRGLPVFFLRAARPAGEEARLGLRPRDFERDDFAIKENEGRLGDVR
jgi:hypothetical protein